MPKIKPECRGSVIFITVLGLLGIGTIIGLLVYFKYVVVATSTNPANSALQILQSNLEVARLQKQLILLENHQSVEPEEAQSPVSEATTTSAINGKKDFIWHDFQFSYPAEWELKSDSENGQYFTKNNQTVATLLCPVPAIGFEAWAMDAKQIKQYTHGGHSYRKEYWLMKPIAGSEDLGWMIMVFGALGLQGGGDSSCMMTLAISNPPTAAERVLAEELYKSIK